MRIQPRARFAAPFVAIVSCSGGPRTEPVHPPDPIATAREMDALPDPVSVPVDAAVADAVVIDARSSPPDRRNPGDRPVYFDPCGGPPDPSQKGCNPPPPSKSSIEAKIVAVNVEGSRVVVTVGAGTRHGVRSNWRAELLSGTNVLPLRISIIRVLESKTFLAASGIEPRDDLRVRLIAPL